MSLPRGTNPGIRNYNRVPQNDGIGTTNSFATTESTSWSNIQAPPVPPRNYNASNPGGMYNSAGYSSLSPYQNPYNRGYGSYGVGNGFMNSFGSYGNNYMYRNNYGGYGSYPSPHDGYMFPGSSIAQMAQNLFSPVFQNSDNMINSLRDITYTADGVLVSIRMLVDALNLVGSNLFRVRDFLQRYAVGFATLGTTHWLFKFIHNLLRLFGLFKTLDESLWSKVNREDPDSGVPKGSVVGNIMVLTAFVTAFSYILPKLVKMIKIHILKEKIETENFNLDDWNPECDAYTPVQAKYNFTSTNDCELSIQIGQRLRMKTFQINQNNLPLWVLVADNNFKKGFVPLNYLIPYDNSNPNQPV